MTTFGDSSALVKLYADEAGHEAVRAVDKFVVAQITRVEVPAALWRKNRTGALARRVTRLLVTRFQDDWFGPGGKPRFGAVPMSTLVLEDAARLAGVHGLRGYDAIQLASARAVRRADPSITTFAVVEGTLRDAASAEDFATLP